MTTLTPDRFPEFFEALWKHPPFAWQRQIARRVVGEQTWPQALALPTAAGKTACIDVAIFAIAVSVQRAGDVIRCRAPRRIFFVVDRRIIVDEAHERAQQIAQRLHAAEDGILREVADALRMCAKGVSQEWEQEKPLLTFKLRGGMYRSEAWARSPLQPIVVTSTVDQVGSRLLFRGYGRGPGMWPVLAGLIANDSIVFLDEAHCARPFLETLRAVDRYRTLAASPVATTFFPVVLSATPPLDLTDVFHDTSDERRDPHHPLGRRQLASKPAALVPPIAGKKSPDPLATAAAEHAMSLATGDRKAIVIFVNRVATARTVYSMLKKHDPVLLTGRMRSLDKDDVNVKLRCLSTRESDSRKLERPKFVVATQTLEVGADFDFDGLVTECASLDALRQRFGRLNRKGRPIDARAVILIRESDTSDTGDPVYGMALSKTWTWLRDQAAPYHEMDFGILSLEKHLPSGPALEALNAPAQSAPVMLPAHLDAWSQTSPAPTPAPEVSLFLHSRRQASTDVQVCWRSDLDLSLPDSRERALELLTYCPPTSAECVPVPIGQLRRWMARQDDCDDSVDIEGVDPSNDVGDEEPADVRSVIRWLNRNENEATLVRDPSMIRPGDIVIIPTDVSSPSGLADFAHSSDAPSVSDLGDRAFRQSQARPLLRLHRELIKPWPISAALREQALDLIYSDVVARLDEDPDDFASKLHELLQRIGHEQVPESWDWLPKTAKSLATDRSIRSLKNVIVPHPFGGVILWSNQRFPNATEQQQTFSDEDDATASGTVAVSLTKHLEGVGNFARRFARASSIPDPQADAVELAARLHDLGKADPRFQRLLSAGRLPGRELLAKSGDIPQGKQAFSRVRQEAGYPRGGRHELLSVRLVESAPGVLPDDNLLRALVLHLVASHHGYCRPFAPVVDDPDPVNVEFDLQGRPWRHSSCTELERLDSGVADRFWTLTRHYGWWGLAWLEAHVRLGDHRCSESEQQQGRDHDAV